MVAVKGPYSSCIRIVCPVYFPLDRIQTLLVDSGQTLCIVDPARWTINRVDNPSAATLRVFHSVTVMALHGYRTAPPRLPLLHIHGYRGLVKKRGTFKA